ncbi:MAG: RNA-binding S4 domain-containing protein [Oscillospiraceae bacterium]
MRLDKYLKVSRLIKRRTVAKEACESSRVTINGKIAKSGTQIKEGDIIEITFAEHVRKDDAKDMYKLLDGEEIE